MSTITMAAVAGTRSKARTTGWELPSVADLRRDQRAPCAQRPAAVRVRVRVTRRARLLLTLLAMVSMAVVLAVVGTGGSTASAGTSTPSTRQRVTVLPGQTLWQIATRAKPGTDPRETVDAILRLNNLTTAEVQVGTALLLP